MYRKILVSFSLMMVVLFLILTVLVSAEEIDIKATDLDFNGDCIVNQADVDLFTEVYGQYCEPGELPQDLNNDGRVFTVDLSLLTNHYTEFEGEIPNCPPEPYNVTAADCDLNNDCVVNDADQDLLLEYYGGDCDTDADINKDGRESASDISYFMSFYGEEVPNCPPEPAFVVEEWHIFFSVNYSKNTLAVINVTGNISWNEVNISFWKNYPEGELLQQPGTENVSVNDKFIISGGNLTLWWPETNSPNETEKRSFGRTFSLLIDEEPDDEDNDDDGDEEPDDEDNDDDGDEEPDDEDNHEDNFDGYTLDSIDFNSDGVIDCEDYNSFQENYGLTGLGTVYDINDDGKMNACDVSYFLNIAEYFGVLDAISDCTEEDTEHVEQNKTIDPIQKEINRIRANISQLDDKLDRLLKRREAFIRSTERWRDTMGPWLYRFAYEQVRDIYDKQIMALERMIGSMEEQIAQLESQQAETFIPNEG